MVPEELCPTTGRACRRRACERGGCQKARSRPAARAAGEDASGRSGADKLAKLTAELAAERAHLRKARSEIDGLRTAIGPLFEQAIDAFEQADVALTYMQESLGVSSSPRLAAIRETKAKMRAALKRHLRKSEPAAAE